jgi:hypothetical protein
MFFDPMALFSFPVKYSFPHILYGSDFYQASYFSDLGNLLSLCLLLPQSFCHLIILSGRMKNSFSLGKQKLLNIWGECKNEGYWKFEGNNQESTRLKSHRCQPAVGPLLWAHSIYMILYKNRILFSNMLKSAEYLWPLLYIFWFSAYYDILNIISVVCVYWSESKFKYNTCNIINMVFDLEDSHFWV